MYGAEYTSNKSESKDQEFLGIVISTLAEFPSLFLAIIIVENPNFGRRNSLIYSSNKMNFIYIKLIIINEMLYLGLITAISCLMCFFTTRGAF